MKLLPFDDYDLKTPRILEILNEASRALAELKGFVNSIPNRHILINVITINEAKEVVDYRSAIWRGYEIIKEKEYISINILVELQSMIEPNKTGIRKTLGTNIVNSVSDSSANGK